jgi:carbon monoxide dehydrogenase subunit G
VPQDVAVERRISAPRERVAALATDPSNDTTWIGGIKRVKVLTEGEIAVGTQVERTASFMGRSFDYVLEIEDLRPGRRVAMRSLKAPFPMTVVYEFEDAEDGTLARIRVDGEPGRLYAVAGPLMDAAVRRNLRRDLERLEQLVAVP